MLIRLSVQVDAQQRQRGGLESHEPRERLSIVVASGSVIVEDTAQHEHAANHTDED